MFRRCCRFPWKETAPPVLYAFKLAFTFPWICLFSFLFLENSGLWGIFSVRIVSTFLLLYESRMVPAKDGSKNNFVVTFRPKLKFIRRKSNTKYKFPSSIKLWFETIFRLFDRPTIENLLSRQIEVELFWNYSINQGNIFLVNAKSTKRHNGFWYVSCNGAYIRAKEVGFHISF